MTMDVCVADKAFDDLDAWITRNGWAGYDPYDIRGQDWFHRYFGRQNPAFRKLRGALAIAEHSLPPLAIRKLLRIRKTVNAKGMGLFASAYLTRFTTSSDQRMKNRADQALSWLEKHANRDYPGVSWGYPFHWQSRQFLPRGTPSVVVTGTVGDAWLQHYAMTGDDRSLKVAEDIAVFFTEGLNRPVDARGKTCFSYTPLDDFKVHNASLFAAAFLAKLSRINGNREYAELALRAAEYTTSEQNADGSFYYWGSEPPTIVDHYHTGFVLRHLDSVRAALPDSGLETAIARGFAFYADRLFSAEGVPKFTPGSLYPINVHSCAEALICLCQLGGRYGRLRLLQSTLAFTLEHMRHLEGWFIAEIRLQGKRLRRMEVPYIRWGQAWMLLALSHVGRHGLASETSEN